MRHALVVVAAIAALVLGACGGDDDGGSSGGDSAQAPTVQDGGSGAGTGQGSSGSTDGGAAGGEGGTGAGGTGSSGGNGGNGSGGRSDGGSGAAPPLDLDDKAPTPKVGGKDRGKAPDVGGPKQTASDFTGVARQIFESSRYFCRQAGVEGMRKEYDIESARPEDIAREAARRNQPRGFPEAVYHGCLEGLR